MTALRVLLCDDEPGMRLILRKILERDPAFTVVAEAGNGKEALRRFEELRPDVIFLDVEMPEMSGVEAARQIADTDPAACIIFATAHQTYRAEAFEVYAFDYLIKPFELERVEETLDRIRRSRSNRERREAEPSESDANRLNKLMIRNKDGIFFIDVSEILLIQREERATVVYTACERYVTSESLGDLMEKLPPRYFLRSHKSYIINLSAITQLYPYGRWTYIVKLKGIKQDALITAEKFAELEQLFGK